MCSIMGLTKAIPEEEFLDGFMRTASRGPDMHRIEAAGEGLLCFHRLAIMGLTEEGMQPFHLGGSMCVCNGELYGFRALKRQLEGAYRFESDSDCELILPLWREHGTDMFGMLDAEFAMVIYDAERDTFIAARDPIGIRPLYYGKLADGSTAFASEPKNLVGLCGKIMPFPPGCYWFDGEFVRYADPAGVTGQYVTDELDAICSGIRERLVAGVEKRLDADAPLGFLLSGSLDSSLVCAIAARLMDKPVRTFAIGMDTDAIDLKYARMVADWIGAEHTEVFMTREEVLAALDEVVALLGT